MTGVMITPIITAFVVVAFLVAYVIVTDRRNR